MRTLLHHRDLPDLSIKKEFNASGTALSENISYINHAFIRGSYREISFDGIHIGYGDLQLGQPALISFEAEAESVELHFALQGNSTASIKGESEDISFESYHHNIMYANQMKGHFCGIRAISKSLK